MPTITIDVDNAPMSAIEAALATLYAEQGRRNRAANLKGQLDMIGREVDSTLGRVDGAVWVQPTGAHNSYRTDAKVTHKGKTWRSLVPFNVWEPGVAGWREDVPAGTVAAWLQPLGALDAYAKDAKVTHGGQAYVSLVAANVWPPTNTTAWKVDAPAPTGPQPWKQPTGAADAYKVGDLMTFGGFTWKSKINANVWSPTDYPAGWEKVR